MIVLYFILLWMPYSLQLGIFEVAGATFTLYILGVFLLIPAAIYRYVYKNFSNTYHLIDMSLLSLNLIFLLTLLWSSDVAQDAYKVLHGVVIPVISYFVLKNMILTESHFKRSLFAFLLGITVFSVIYVVMSLKSGMSNRIDVLLQDSIAVGTFTIFSIILLLGSSLVINKVKYVMAVVNIIALIATLSRGYLVGLILSPFLYFLFMKGKYFLVVTSIILGTLFITIVSIENKELFKPTSWDPQLENSTERLYNIDYWKNGIYGRLESFQPSVEIVKENLFLGVGFSNSGVGSTVHNFHLEWLSYSGLLGYILFCFIIINQAIRIDNIKPYDKYLTVFAVVITTILINGLMNGVMHGMMPYMLFNLFAFIEVRLALLRNTEDETQDYSDIKNDNRIKPGKTEIVGCELK